MLNKNIGITTFLVKKTILFHFTGREFCEVPNLILYFSLSISRSEDLTSLNSQLYHVDSQLEALNRHVDIVTHLQAIVEEDEEDSQDEAGKIFFLLLLFTCISLLCTYIIWVINEVARRQKDLEQSRQDLFCRYDNWIENIN